MISRDDSLKILHDAEIRLFNEGNTTNTNNLLFKISNELANLKTVMIKIIGNLIKLRKMMLYGINRDKYNTKAKEYSYLLEPDYISKLNQSLQFLREGAIGKRFNIKSKFDPLLLDFDNKINNIQCPKNLLLKYSHGLLNEMITNNFQLTKGQPSASSIRKLLNKPPSNTTIQSNKMNNQSIFANNSNCSIALIQKNEEQNKLEDYNKNAVVVDDDDKQAKRNKKEKIECKEKEKEKEKERKNNCDIDINIKMMINNSSKAHLKDIMVKEVPDDYINDHEGMNIKKVNHVTKDKTNQSPIINFYTDSLANFNQVYKDYYHQIPIYQQNVFHLNEDINLFIEGINPLLIVQYLQGRMSSVCHITTDAENSAALCIRHFSSVNDNLIDSMSQFITFIQSNIFFKEITIDLYHENIDGKMQLRKEINEVFKSLKFRWVKLENLEDGTRFQAMKFANINNHNANPVNKEPQLEIRSGMIGLIDLNTVNNNDNDNNAQDNHHMNLINKQMISSLISKSDKRAEIKEWFNYLNGFEGNENETNSFLTHKGFNLKDFEINQPINHRNQSLSLYASCFEIFPQFDCFFSKKINQYIYNRIKVSKEVFYEKETNQYFNILQQDNYLILIGEMSPQFIQFVNSSTNIYEAFNVIYSNFEEGQKDNTVLWVPSFSLCDKAQCLYDNKPNTMLSSISTVLFRHCNYRDKTIDVQYNEREAIISNPFFLSIININQTVSVMDNSIVFCCVVDESNWDRS